IMRVRGFVFLGFWGEASIPALLVAVRPEESFRKHWAERAINDESRLAADRAQQEFFHCLETGEDIVGWRWHSRKAMLFEDGERRLLAELRFRYACRVP